MGEIKAMVVRNSVTAARRRARTKVTQEGQGYSFRGFLRDQAARSGLRKGKRTEARIKWSTCELLERMALSALKIQDVCSSAEIGQGTFYLYFPDRQALLNAVLLEYVEFIRVRMTDRPAESKDHIDSVRWTTMVYYRLFENNRGLMKCLISYYEDFPAISRIASKMNRDWIEINVRSMKKRLKSEGRAGAISDEELFRRFYALGGMVDQYLSYIFLVADESVLAVSPSMEEVIDTLSHIWIRGSAS
jgi:TetR/AcrR family transcriptional regulator, ethionamide resistance regulator